jgi:ABC-type amino acid transport substrate-binding protein
VFGAILLAITYVVTLFQRKLTRDFPQRWHEGLADSFYHVMSVAMNGKTNYAAGHGALGKVLAGIWLMCGVAVVAYITSSVTSIMTLNKLKNEINGVQDLNGKLVGVMKGTAAEEFCQKHQIFVKTYTDPVAAVADLVSHQTQALIGEAASLQYYDKAHPELPITEVGSVFSDEKYAFGVPKNSDLRTELNIQLLMLQEGGFLHDLQVRYFGDP